MERKAVRYVHFPDTEDGLLGFYHEPTNNQCIEPRYFYKHSEKSWGYCHIQNAAEMDDLAIKIGAKTRGIFKIERESAGFKTWLDAYSDYLSQEIGNALQENGILLEIRGREILFYCPKGQFVPWKGKPGLT